MQKFHAVFMEKELLSLKKVLVKLRARYYNSLRLQAIKQAYMTSTANLFITLPTYTREYPKTVSDVHPFAMVFKMMSDC